MQLCVIVLSKEFDWYKQIFQYSDSVCHPVASLMIAKCQITMKLIM